MQLPVKVISGGQTGADRAGLDFAISRAIEHGGFCPSGRRSDDGVIPSRYLLTATPNYGYEQRTEWNVRDSDGTLLFNRGQSLSSGTALTLRFCQRYEKPYHLVRLPRPGEEAAAIPVAAKGVAEFIARHQPSVLNVAGNRERTTPGIGLFVQAVLGAAWDLLPTLKLDPVPEALQGLLFEPHEPRSGRKSR